MATILVNKPAEITFQLVYDRLSVEYANVIPREAIHAAVYSDIVERCAMIASAHSPNGNDIGEIIRKTMGVK
jgi:hypothetical protein